jgi:anti-anti-sigma factor
MSAQKDPQATILHVAIRGRFCGGIDTTMAGILRECLDQVVRRNPGRLIINLAAVGFLDSSAVHAFVDARHALPRNWPVVLRSPQRQARLVFKLTGLDSVCLIE